jgi:putative membrane protein
MSLFAGPFFPIAAFASFCRYSTLRYRFDEDGVSMSVGVFFKREVNLTYRRIQDIHLSRNFVQRWMGLANVAVQTASGNAGAEMTIEGVLEADALRDFLYSKMGGARHEDEPPPSILAGPAPKDEVLALLTEIRDGLKEMLALRERQP